MTLFTILNKKTGISIEDYLENQGKVRRVLIDDEGKVYVYNYEDDALITVPADWEINWNKESK